MIKKYLRSGVMENGVAVKTEEGSPQVVHHREEIFPRCWQISILTSLTRNSTKEECHAFAMQTISCC